MIKILICDDHPIVSSGLRELFSDAQGYEIVGSVESARDISPTIHRTCPDLLFLDVNMGGVSTVEQIAAFKEIRPTLHIVVFSSYNLPSIVTRAFSEGADAYLLKSSSRFEILDACTALGKQQKFIGSEVNLRNADRQNIIGDGQAIFDKFEALHQLTAREREIFNLVAEGKTELEIAEKLFLSKHTVHTHRKNLMAKLKLHSSADFVRFLAELK